MWLAWDGRTPHPSVIELPHATTAEHFTRQLARFKVIRFGYDKWPLFCFDMQCFPIRREKETDKKSNNKDQFKSRDFLLPQAIIDFG